MFNEDPLSWNPPLDTENILCQLGGLSREGRTESIATTFNFTGQQNKPMTRKSPVTVTPKQTNR
jgi:hypothetical protein